MNLTKEQIQKAMQCKTVEELLELTKAEGFELSREEAEAFVAKLNSNELTEEELKEVAGGVWYCPTFCGDFKCYKKFCPEVADTCNYCGHCSNFVETAGGCYEVN